MFTAALFTIAKTWNQPKCPSMIDCTGKMWHIYTMEYYAAIKNNEFMSFAGTWMNLETIILSKLTQEKKMKYQHVLTHRWVLNNENTWTQGGEHYTLGSVGGNRGGTAGGGKLRRDSMGEMSDIGEGEEGSKSHCQVCTYASILPVLHMYPKT